MSLIERRSRKQNCHQRQSEADDQCFAPIEDRAADLRPSPREASEFGYPNETQQSHETQQKAACSTRPEED